MSIEAEVALLTTAVTAQTNAVIANQLITTNAQADALATKNRVDALNFVDNTTDLLKPISTVTQGAIDLKNDTLVSGTNIKSINSISLLGSGDFVVLSAPTSLRYLDYEDRGNLRIVGVPEPLADDSTVVEGIGLFQFVDSTLETDEDETCFTASDNSGQWLLAVPAYDWLSANDLIEESYRDELDEDEDVRFEVYLEKTGR
jgi:hypothetical protein